MSGSVKAPPRSRFGNWGLFHRRACLVPTRRGFIVLGIILVVMIQVFIRTVHPFLAVNRPQDAKALVVQGWVPDYVLKEAVAEFHRHPYSKVYVTGCPLERGTSLSAYKNYAELGTASLLKLGIPEGSIQAVPAPQVVKDRTYTEARTLKVWFQEHQISPGTMNLVTIGPHARRSRMLFQKAFDTDLGIIAVPSNEYEPDRWWASSAGFRTVTDELIAYGYARLFFWPRN